MFAGRSVQTGVRQTEALDRFAAEDVRFNDLFDVAFGDGSVPHCVRVDDDVGAMFALVEAAGLIRAHSPLQPALGQSLFEELLQPGLRLRIAAPARMARRTLVSADENMSFELWHQTFYYIPRLHLT